MPANRDHRSAERPNSGDAGGQDGRVPTSWVGRRMWIRGLVMLALALPPAAGVLSEASGAHAPAAPSTALQSPRPRPAVRHAIKTVFLIVMENYNWSDVKGNPSAP